MRAPAHADAFQVLLLQAVDGGLVRLLLGGSLACVADPERLASGGNRTSPSGRQCGRFGTLCPPRYLIGP